MQILLPATYSILFIFLILKMNFFDCANLPRLQLIGLFVLKIIAGLGVYAIYTYYYSGSDFHVYFRSGKIAFDQFLGNTTNVSIPGWYASFDNSFFNNSRIIILINFLIEFLSFNNVFVHILFFCFFAFVGLTALYKAFQKYFPDKKSILILGLYLVPSVLFWTAGIYKETIAICCIGLIIYLSDFGLVKSINIKTGVILVSLLLLLFFVKVYILAALLPLLIINWLISKINSTKFLLKYFSIFVSLIFAFHLLSKISDKFNVYQLIADKQAKAISEAKGGIFLVNEYEFVRLDYKDQAGLIQHDSVYSFCVGTPYMSWKLNNMRDTTLVVSSDGSSEYKILYTIFPANSISQINKMQPTIWGALQKTPSAILNVFVQPTLFSIKNVLQLFSWIENMWLILMIVLAILFLDKKIFLQKEVLLFCLMFTLIQFVMIGLTSPAIGAMVRYKVTALPFIFVMAMLCIDGEKLLKKLKRTKN